MFTLSIILQTKDEGVKDVNQTDRNSDGYMETFFIIDDNDLKYVGTIENSEFESVGSGFEFLLGKKASYFLSSCDE